MRKGRESWAGTPITSAALAAEFGLGTADTVSRNRNSVAVDQIEPGVSLTRAHAAQGGVALGPGAG